MSTLDVDPQLESLLRSATTRAAAPLAPRHRRVEAGSAVALVLVCIGLSTLVSSGRVFSPTTAAVLLLGLTVASGVRFSLGAASGSPTQPMVIAAAMLLPPAAAVAVCLLADVLVRSPDYLRRRAHPDHVLLHFGDAWPAVGPALAFGLLAPGAPSLDAWPVLLVALALQLALETATFEARAWLAHGVPPRLGMRSAALSFLIDGALAPIGLVVAVVAANAPAALLAPVPLMGLLAVFGQERERRLVQALALSDAYRGTALLMGEMLEAEDPYTGGEHSWGVVSLVLDVGDVLGVSGNERRHLEFAALLHDIGKLRTPPEILGKPGALTEAEWAVVRRHPVDGQQMLERVGGLLAEIGPDVRGHHERWDGGGYPDGLAGEDIPLAARIICVCDAFSAMTTNRPYRAALPVGTALAEIEACSGTQFDPAVVAALLAVGPQEPPSAAHAGGTLARA